MSYLLRKSLAYLRTTGVTGLARKTAGYAWLQVAALAAVPVLRRRARSVTTVSEAFDFARTFSFGGVAISALQRRVEIEGLLRLLERERPRVLVEIGTALGGTLFMFTRVAADDATLLSIDLRGGEYGGGYPLARMPLYRAFARARQRIHLIRASSHDPATLERARALLGGRVVDFLFIDGDHTYDGARADFEMYGPLLRSGGLVAFHDIAPTADPEIGVPQLWAELREGYESQELMEKAVQTSRGIGLLRMP